MNNFRKLLIFALIIGLFIMAGCGSGSESSESDTDSGSDKDSGDTLKIGAVLPMTGDSSVFGEKFRAAYTMAIEEINENGGVDGKQLELVIEDSQEKPQIGKTATEKLVNDDGILALTGGRSSGVTLTEAQVAEEHSVPYLIDHGTSDLATMEGYEYVFRLNPTAGMYTTALKEYFESNPPTSIAHIIPDDAFGEAIYDYGMKEYVDDSGVTYELFKFNSGELDFKPIIEKVKNMDPQIVMMTAANDNDATQIIKAAQESNLSPEMFIGTGGGHSIQGFYDQAGDLTETVLSAGPWHGNKKDPKWQEFFDKFTETYGHEPGEHEVEGYTAIYILAEAFERAESLDREGVKAALEETDMETIFGQIKFEDFDGYNNQNHGMTEIAQWIDGKMVTVYPEEYAEAEIVLFDGWD